MSAHPAIKQCAVVPILDKRIHDTVPVLYVVPAETGAQAAETVRKALTDVYVRDRKVTAENLPTQFVLVDEIPLNANGKLDIFQITRERIGGDAYNLVPVMDGDTLSDIRTEHMEHVNSMTAGTLPTGMENRSAYNVFDLFTDAPSKSSSRFGKKVEERFSLPEIPDSVWKTVLKYGNRLMGMMVGKKDIRTDFED